MSIPSFKVNSKPELSQAEQQKALESQGSNFISEPGTYDFLIKSFKFKETPSEKDNAWISATVELVSGDNKTMRAFVMVPTECRNSFMFGEKKQGFAYENLCNFLRGLGHILNYDNAMSEIAEIFGNPDKYIVGQTIRARVAYKGVHIKYNGKNEINNTNQYVIVDTDHETVKYDGVFADRKAAEAVINETPALKKTYNNFPETKEYFSPQGASGNIISGSAASISDSDLPF